MLLNKEKCLSLLKLKRENMIQEQIDRIEARIEFLKQDTTKIISAWAQPAGCTPYNHGPYFRKLEIKRLKARLKTLQKKLAKC
jgi:hypothetical protein